MKNKTPILLIVLILVGCLGQINADMYTPSFKAITRSLRCTDNIVQLSLSLYLLSMGLSQLIYGPISEGIGRRLTIIIGIIINIIGAVIVAHTNTSDGLLLGRVIQGLGAGAAAALYRSILRDSFSGHQLTKMIAYFTNGAIFICITSPVLGGFIQDAFGWRTTFLTLIGYSIVTLILVITCLRETNTQQSKDKLNVHFLLNSYRELITDRGFLGCCLCVFLTYGGLFAWFTSGSLICVKMLGISPATFGLLNILTGLSVLIGTNLNTKISKRFGASAAMQLGWSTIAIAGISILTCHFIMSLNIWMIIIPVCLFIAGAGFIWPNTFTTAFNPFGHIAGYASAIYGCIQIIGGAFFSTVLSYIPETNALPLAIAISLSGILALLCFLIIVKPTMKKASS